LEARRAAKKRETLMLTDHGPFRSDDERNKDSLEREEEKSREVKFGKEP